MSIRIVAVPRGAKDWAIHIAGAEFGRDSGRARTPAECPPGVCLEYDKTPAPRYPPDLALERVSGTVYVVQEIGRDGHVLRQAVRQVDLRARSDEGQMAAWRRVLAHDTLAVSRDWTYHVPTVDVDAARGDWLVTVPVNFALQVAGGPPPSGKVYGEWDAYVPGPVQQIAWLKSAERPDRARGISDAVPNDGRPFVEDGRFVLLTTLGGQAPAPPAGQPSGQG